MEKLTLEKPPEIETESDLDFLIGIDPGGKGAVFIEDLRSDKDNAFLITDPASIYDDIICESGRYYFLDTALFRAVEEVTESKGRGKSKKTKTKIVRTNWFDGHKLMNFFSFFYDYKVLCGIEKVHGMPGQGAMFQFGAGYGRLLMALESMMTLDEELILIQPQAWKKHFNLKGKKNELTEAETSICCAIEMCPELNPIFRPKQKHPVLKAAEIDLTGRADAFLIGKYVQSLYVGVEK